MSDLYCSMPNCQKRAHEKYQGSPLCSNCLHAYIRGRNEERDDAWKHFLIQEAERDKRNAASINRGY